MSPYTALYTVLAKTSFLCDFAGSYLYFGIFSWLRKRGNISLHWN